MTWKINPSPFSSLFRSALFFTVALFTPATSVLAGNYLLVKGKGIEVCETYARALNSKGQKDPMICDRADADGVYGIARADWKTIDVWENRQLVTGIEEFLGNFPSGTPEEWEQQLQARVEEDRLVIQRASIDIDGDKHAESVLRIRYEHCPSMGRYVESVRLLVVKNNTVNNDLSQHLLPSYGWTSDMFTFRGVAYFDKWYRDIQKRDTEEGTLEVFKVASRSGYVGDPLKNFFTSDKSTTVRVCVYEFRL